MKRFFPSLFCSIDFLSLDWGNSMVVNLEADCFETKNLAPRHIQNLVQKFSYFLHFPLQLSIIPKLVIFAYCTQ